jgi:hypothetical protein
MNTPHIHKNHILEYARQEANDELEYFDWFFMAPQMTDWLLVTHSYREGLVRPTWCRTYTYKTEPNSKHPQYQVWLEWQKHVKLGRDKDGSFGLTDLIQDYGTQIINWGLDQYISIVEN